MIEKKQRIGSIRETVIRDTDNNKIKITFFDHNKTLDLYKKKCLMAFSYLISLPDRE